MKTIEMNVAIIPNKAYKAIDPEWMSDGIIEMRRREYTGWNKRFGIDLRDDDKAVEIWYGSEEDSFQNGDLPEEFDEFFPVEVDQQDEDFDIYGNRRDIAPYWLPARIFEGHKEGDTVEIFRSKNCVVMGRLAQQQNRYARFGTFEEVLEMVTK